MYLHKIKKKEKQKHNRYLGKKTKIKHKQLMQPPPFPSGVRVPSHLYTQKPFGFLQ